VSEIEPRKRQKKELAVRHIPQEIVPVPIAEVRDFVRDAVNGTNLRGIVPQVLSGWVFFEPHLRFTAVDDAHTRIELDVVGTSRAEKLLYMQRRAQIHRFFVALDDELDRRERWRPQLPISGASTEAADEAPEA
jgi:hypothetical protein